jgi:endonuclease/exonuclease/phosphatase family metal-dependent hydrolase
MNSCTTTARPLPSRRRAGSLAAAVLALGMGVGTMTLQAPPAMAATPSSFSAVSSTPGTRPGEVTISWTQSGKNTARYEIETGLTSFSATQHARGSKVFRVPAGRSSVTLTAAQTASAGAPVGSGNHLYFRLRAISVDGTVRAYPYQQVVGVAPAAPAATGTPVRIGTFNVRTARATTDARTWLQRAPDVAASIVDHDLDLVALQELGPGRADGQTGTTKGVARQTDSLVTALQADGGSRYKLVRTTPYVKSGTLTGTQGARILYDSSKYSLVSPCVETSADGSYSSSCSIKLPLRPTGDTEASRRRAAYAEFSDKTTGEHVVVVSAHLDQRHDSDPAVEKTYNTLRGEQAKTVLAKLAVVNPNGYPVVFGGDINSYQNNKVGYAPHDELVKAGFYDTAAAARQVNIHFTTINDFKTTLTAPTPGFGARIDTLAVEGVVGASSWENVLKPTDDARPSDHNMLVADIRLPLTNGTAAG